MHASRRIKAVDKIPESRSVIQGHRAKGHFVEGDAAVSEVQVGETLVWLTIVLGLEVSVSHSQQ